MEITYISIGIGLFALSCIRNILLCYFVFAKYESTKKIKVPGETKVMFFACISDIIAFLVSLFLNLLTHFKTDFVQYFKNENILFFGMGTITYYTVYNRCISVFIGMLCIFLFDYFIAFRNWFDVSKKHKLLLSIIFAVVNAPYFFLIDIENIIRFIY